MRITLIPSWLYRAMAAVVLFVSAMCPAVAGERVTYLVLAETVEPIMIVRDGDPMTGGIMTEIVELIFDGSTYDVEPTVLPWQRMQVEFANSDNWIVHGFPESFDEESQADFSEYPIFPFNHSAVTLKINGFEINEIDDLDGRTLILVENFQYPVLDEFLAKISNRTVDADIGVIEAFTPAGSLSMLRHGRGDVVVDWEARIIYNLVEAGLSFEDVEIHDATRIVPTKNMHLVFSARQSDEFRSFVNSRIKALTDSGELMKLAQKYYSPSTPPAF